MDNLQTIRVEVEKIVEAERNIYAPLVQGGSAESGQDYNSIDVLDAVKCNEDGDAKIYIICNWGLVCYDSATGRYYIFFGHYWQEDKLGEAIQLVDSVIDVYGREVEKQNWRQLQAVRSGRTEEAEKYKNNRDTLMKRIWLLQTLARKEHILELARTGSDSLAVRGDIFDANHMLFACKNVVINLLTAEPRQGNFEDYIRTFAPVEFHGLNEPAPNFERFIAEIFNNNSELVSFVQRLLGYCITGVTIEHIVPILWGIGRNGKTTLIEIISHVLGPYAGQIEPEMLLSNKFGRQSGGPSPDILALFGKRFMTGSETEQHRTFNVPKIKLLSGGDTLVARPLYGKDYLRSQPTHKILLLTNHKPHADADDYAFWKRVVLIPFELSFVDEPKEPHERKADTRLLEKLKTEAPGILAWLVRGCLAWQKQGLKPPECVKAATQAYREDEDQIQQFIDSRCFIGDGLSTRAGEMFNEYKLWAEDAGYESVNGTIFGTSIKKRFVASKNAKGIAYQGVCLSWQVKGKT